MISLPSDLARRVLDAAPDALIIIDASGVIRFANQRISPLFGYAPEEVIGRSVEMLLPERIRERHVAHRLDYAQNLRVRPMGVGLELYGRQRDGTEFPVEISLSPVAEQGETLVAAAIRDVSDRRRVEAELRAARQSAESAREAADRANQGKSRFLAAASHDLRQPLQTLALLNGSLRRLVADPGALEALHQQEQTIGAMSQLLNSLLDISKLESGAITPEPTDFAVAMIFEELRREFASIAASKGLRLSVEPCAHAVRGDPSLVAEILRNLVANAIKYTCKGWVTLRSSHEAASVRIEVLDTGIGIPADHLPYIYDEFYQVSPAANRARDGYGLGLSIVQRLARLLALELAVQSEVGRGSIFSLRLPASERHVVADGGDGATGVQIAACADGRPKRRVLLIEDDRAVQRATRLLLEVEGYEVMVAGSLREALAAAQAAGRLDVLIADYHLGDGQTGVQAIGAVRQLVGAPVTAVLMTADTSAAIKELRLDPNVHAASKPVNAEQLLRLLASVLVDESVAVSVSA